MIHVRDKDTQRLTAPFTHQAAVVGARVATDDDIADGVAEKRNTRLLQHTLHDSDDVFFAKRGGGLGQEFGQEFGMARVHGARL
jgi:hypothetical protein